LTSELDHQAWEAGESHSAILAAAVAAFLARLDAQELTESMNRVYGEQPLSADDRAWLDLAARQTFARLAADEDEPW
jgi:hypothetical protein